MRSRLQLFCVFGCIATYNRFTCLKSTPEFTQRVACRQTLGYA